MIAADILPVSLLVLINCAGYLPYSDRPGPGWQPAHLPSTEELQFFFEFAVLILRGSAHYGLGFAVAAPILGFCRLPRWSLRILATPTAFLSAGLFMANAGWMIAISSSGVYLAACCGATWGLFVFPRLVPVGRHAPPMAVRIGLPTVVLTGAVYLLIRPFLPDPALTNAKIEVIQRNDKGADIRQLDLGFLGRSVAQEAKGQQKYVSLARMEFTTDGRNQVSVLLVVDDAKPVAGTFHLPRTGNAIYRQSRGVWKQERSEGRNSAISVELTPIDSGAIHFQPNGPCCSSMAQTIPPYR